MPRWRAAQRSRTRRSGTSWKWMDCPCITPSAGGATPLVLLHGNASMIEDFVTSGLVDAAAARYRVIAFDRPGYGHTPRPRGKVWTARAQAILISKALRLLGVTQAIVLGH